MNQYLLSLAVHLEALGQRLRLSLYHTFASEDHEALNLMLVDINFARSLIVRMQYVLILLVHLLR